MLFLDLFLGLRVLFWDDLDLRDKMRESMSMLAILSLTLRIEIVLERYFQRGVGWRSSLDFGLSSCICLPR